ncbi:hypothetical protein SC911_002219 [Salmonella enterica]|nr:hypothetical protein [Salmonella enterica]EBF2170934.1 hypothetical protein [Salmonella enterica]EBI4450444.1 hypothetical protein [Salmonella enterica]EBI8728054.1 hypothetical protein [Salmonella enterica]ECQ9844032.1 hypothetical protein [Salmonella enterica]
MQAIGMTVFFVVGLFQMAAIGAGIEYWTGWPAFVSIIIGLTITYIPLVGQIAGIVGAVNGWGWEWWQASLLFFGGLLLPIVLGGGEYVLSRFRK